MQMVTLAFRKRMPSGSRRQMQRDQGHDCRFGIGKLSVNIVEKLGTRKIVATRTQTILVVNIVVDLDMMKTAVIQNVFKRGREQVVLVDLHIRLGQWEHEVMRSEMNPKGNWKFGEVFGARECAFNIVLGISKNVGSWNVVKHFTIMRIWELWPSGSVGNIRP